MSVKAVARNYAEALLTLAEGAKAVEPWAELIDAVAEGVRLAPEAEAVLMSPKVTKAAKAKLIAQARLMMRRRSIRDLSGSNEASLRLQAIDSRESANHPRLLHQPDFAWTGRSTTVGAGGCHLGGR